MSSSKPSLSGNFEIAAQTMLVALEKAGAELTRNVNQCVEQLSSHCLALQSSLDDQLNQIRERYQSFVESNIDELEEYKEKLLKQLAEFEQGEIETIVDAGNSLRQSLNSHTDQVLAKLTQQVEKQMAMIANATGQDIAHEAASVTPQLREMTETGKEQLAAMGSSGEQSVGSRIQELEAELSGLVNNWKDSVEAKVKSAQVELGAAAAEAQNNFDAMLKQSLTDMAKNSKQSTEVLDEAVADGVTRTQADLQTFQSKVAALVESLGKTLEQQRQLSDEDRNLQQNHSMSVATQEISHLTQEAQEKIQAAYAAYQRSLARMEHDYSRQFTHLTGRFDTALAEASVRFSGVAGMQARAAGDWQDKLESQLTARGAEVLKSVAKLAEQLESECLKSTNGMQERIENIKEDTLSVMEKQVQAIKTDSDRSVKKFLESLSALESHLEQIEEAGKAAAVTVMAYRSAHLSLGGSDE